MKTNRISYSHLSTGLGQFNQSNRNNQNNVNFTALSLKRDILPVSSRSRHAFVREVNILTAFPKEEVKKYLSIFGSRRMDFFHSLANRYSSMDINSRRAQNVTRDTMNNIYNSIKRPNRYHFSLINNERYPMNELAGLLKSSQNNPDLFKEIIRLGREGVYLDVNTFKKLLSMEEGKQLVKRFDDFRSYIIVKHKNRDFVRNLLKELSAPKLSFNPQTLDRKLAVEKLRHDSIILSKISSKTLFENYNSKGFELFDENHQEYSNLLPKNRKPNRKDIDFIANIIRTTTEENYFARKSFIKKNFSNLNNSTEDIQRFFNQLDADKNFRELYEQMIERDHLLVRRPIREFMFYTDSFGSKTLLKKSESFFDIVRKNDGRSPEEVRDIISKNLNNRFYITQRQLKNARDNDYYTRVQHVFTGDFRISIDRLKRRMRYEVLPKIFGTGKETPIVNNVKYEPPAAVKIKQKYTDKKLQIKNEGVEIIKKHMKTKKDYTGDIKQFTKVKNALLDDMFRSVAEKRKEQRLNGIKNPTVSNKDVILLYKRINGKNKNIVKYFLTKRKADGSLEFDIQQVIKLLDSIESARSQSPSNRLVLTQNKANLNINVA